MSFLQSRKTFFFFGAQREVRVGGLRGFLVGAREESRVGVLSRGLQ